jgi:hypothetical protein
MLTASIAQTDEAADQRWIVNLLWAIFDPTAFKIFFR